MQKRRQKKHSQWWPALSHRITINSLTARAIISLQPLSRLFLKRLWRLLWAFLAKNRPLLLAVFCLRIFTSPIIGYVASPRLLGFTAVYFVGFGH